MNRILVAWFWVNFLGVIVGYFLSPLAFFWGGEWWHVMWVVSFLVNLRALYQADRFLSKRLGDRKISIYNQSRGVSVFDYLAELLPSEKTPQEIVEINEGISIKRDDGELITWRDVEYFVRRAWGRQRNGKHGLSRNYWTQKHRPTWERQDYDAIMAVLVQLGLIRGRKSGASGKLSGPSQWTLNQLRDKLS